MLGRWHVVFKDHSPPRVRFRLRAFASEKPESSFFRFRHSPRWRSVCPLIRKRTPSLKIISSNIQAFTSPNSSTAAAVTFITFVQDLKKKTKAWTPLIELCASGEKTLERFRYQFPDDWLYSDQLRGEWSAYNEILKRKNDSIQEQLGMHPHKISGRCSVNQYTYH